MSEVNLNIIAANEAIHGKIHGSVADAVVAALSAEPETIAELEAALQRFIKPVDDHRQFASFRAGADEEAWDAGILVVDLEARIVAIESTYSSPQPEGEIEYHDGSKATDVMLFYRVPNDWLFVHSLDQYKSARRKHIAKRAGVPPLNIRQVLYGRPMLEFILLQCAASEKNIDSSSSVGTEIPRAISPSLSDQSAVASGNPQYAFSAPQFTGAQRADPQFASPVAEIHAKWLTTPRADLRGQTPREVMLANLDFINFDLHTREMQWSLLGEGPPPLARDSFAYRFGGFGTHEYVLYYDLIRHLLSECWQPVHSERPIDLAGESLRLNKVKEEWLNSPQPDLDGRVPGAIIESERRRVPLVMSAKSMIIDEDCEWCQMLAADTGDAFGPGFWHLDGCNMDEGFVFSFHRTLQKWEEEQRRHQEFFEQFEREWAEKHGPGA